MLQVMTSEIHADFTGFPLSVTVEHCTCTDGGACSNCETATVIIAAAERADGACAQTLVFRGLSEDVRRVLSDALAMLEAAE